MDDIGSTVTEFSQLLPSLRKIFDCIRRSGLKLSPEKCEIASQSIKFLGSTITNEGISPQAEKIKKFLKKITMPRTTKQVKILIGFAQLFRNFIPNLGEKLIPFYQLLRKGADFEAKETHCIALETVKKDLLEATEMTLRLPKPGLQYVLLCDASYYGSGFVLMVEDYVTGKQSKEKVYAPVSFGSQLCTTAQLKFSTYYKEFLALYFALDQFSHYIWASSHPVIVLTDNRSLTNFFHSKAIPPSLWNFLDRVLSFNIIIAHIPCKANYAADFLSRVQTDKGASLSLKLTDKVPVREIYVESEAKSPDVSISNIDQLNTVPESEIEEVTIISQLQELGLYNAYIERKRENGDEINSIFKLKRAEVNAIQYANQADLLNDLSDRRNIRFGK